MILYKDILNYLDAIAAASGDVADAPHGVWWKVTAADGTVSDLPYDTFKNGKVPGVGADVSIMNLNNPSQSAFFQILLGPVTAGGSSFNQMPDGGPFITDNSGAVVFNLADGSTITGQQIRDNIQNWLDHGFPQ